MIRYSSLIFVGVILIGEGVGAADETSFLPENRELISAIRRRDHSAVKGLVLGNDRQKKEPQLPSFFISPLTEAIGQRDRDIVILLLAHGANLEEHHAIGGTPLCTAAGVGNVQIVDVLIAAGANVNPAADYSPLMCAASHGHVAVCRRLIRAGATVDLRRDEGRQHSALMLAAMVGHSSVVKCLLDRGADPNLMEKGPGGQTALMYAATFDRADAIRVLIRGRAEVNLRNEMGKTALDVALEYGRKDVVKVLEQAGAKRNPALPRNPKSQEKSPTPKTPSQAPGDIEEKKQEEGFEGNPPDRKITQSKSD